MEARLSKLQKELLVLLECRRQPTLRRELYTNRKLNKVEYHKIQDKLTNAIHSLMQKNYLIAYGYLKKINGVKRVVRLDCNSREKARGLKLDIKEIVLTSKGRKRAESLDSTISAVKLEITIANNKGLKSIHLPQRNARDRKFKREVEELKDLMKKAKSRKERKKGK